MHFMEPFMHKLDKEFKILFPEGIDMTKMLEASEAVIIRRVLEQARYNQTKAAKYLGISRGNLRTKLKLYFQVQYIQDKDR